MKLTAFSRPLPSFHTTSQLLLQYHLQQEQTFIPRQNQLLIYITRKTLELVVCLDRVGFKLMMLG